jgi:hypothetical protein
MYLKRDEMPKNKMYLKRGAMPKYKMFYVGRTMTGEERLLHTTKRSV